MEAAGVKPNPNPDPVAAVLVPPPKVNPEACVDAVGVAPRPKPPAPGVPPRLKPDDGVGAATPSPVVAVVFGVPNREGKPDVVVAGVEVAPNAAG